MPKGALTADEQELKRLIQTELLTNRSHALWGGSGVGIQRNQFGLTGRQRAQVQAVGQRHGCHTCGTHLATDPDQPWIGDHIPPTALLKKLKRMHPMSRIKQVLFPQCHDCDYQQGALVRRLGGNRGAILLSSNYEKKLIFGGKPKIPRYCIRATGPKVKPNEGNRIQKLGARNGCHSCGAQVPTTTYHSDHTFPQEFCTHYMEQVFDVLGLAFPQNFELRPQCPRCSGDQGGAIRRIRTLALRCAKANGITAYKF